MNWLRLSSFVLGIVIGLLIAASAAPFFVPKCTPAGFTVPRP